MMEVPIFLEIAGQPEMLKKNTEMFFLIVLVNSLIHPSTCADYVLTIVYSIVHGNEYSNK